MEDILAQFAADDLVCKSHHSLVLLGLPLLSLGSRVVSVLDSGAVGPGFKSQSRRCRVTVLGKLFTPIVPLFTKRKIGSSPLKGCEGNCGPGEK